MNENKVKVYILENIDLNGKRPLGKFLIYSRNYMLLLIFISVFAGFLYGVINNYSNIFTKIWFVFFSISIPLNIFLSLKKFKRNLNDYKSTESSANLNKSNSYSLAGIGSAIGIWISRILYGEIRMYVYLILLSVIIIICTHAFSIFAYNYYLLKKYCPDLMKYRPPKSTK
jgi:hypothetical protein